MQRAWLPSVASGLFLVVPVASVPALGGPPAGNLPEARPAPLYNPVSRCPSVRMADEGTIAVVAFLVGSTGVPSQASIRTSSQSKDLDAAALDCVMKLRFLPSVRAGEGIAVDSWQQLGWRWTQKPQADGSGATQTSAPAAVPPAAMATGSATTAAAGAAAAGGAALGGAAAAAPGTAAGAGTGGSPPAIKPVQLRVCADEAGRLTQDPTIIHSSGNPGLDQAAVRIAKSGSGNYRPAPTLNGKPTSGCAQLSIAFE